ncbi:hypothetical protein [Ureaplasma ceti]|uniref:Cytadherence high molecular weight protein 1 n=1 Tax=Ureaplasma ceti TaxID=3119530 RepID=A0ABP9U9C5_9BACT
MPNRDIDAKIAVISNDDAKKLGIKKEKENLVTIDGQIVDLEWIDEFAEDWHLPSIVLKAQAYLKTLKSPENKKYVNLNSNKYENFNRLVEFDVIEGTSLDKVRQFLVLNEYGPESAIDEFNYGVTAVESSSDAEKIINKIANNIKVYNEQTLENQALLNEAEEQFENFEISDEEYIDKKSDAIASLKIMVLSIYRDMVLLNSISDAPVNFELADSCTSPEELAKQLAEVSEKTKDLKESAEEDIAKVETQKSVDAPVSESCSNNDLEENSDNQKEEVPEETNLPEEHDSLDSVINESEPYGFTVDSTSDAPELQKEWTPEEFSSEGESHGFTVDSTDALAETQKEWVPEEFAETHEVTPTKEEEPVVVEPVETLAIPPFDIDSWATLFYYHNEWIPSEFNDAGNKPKTKGLFRKKDADEELDHIETFYLVNNARYELDEAKLQKEWVPEEFEHMSTSSADSEPVSVEEIKPVEMVNEEAPAEEVVVASHCEECDELTVTEPVNSEKSVQPYDFSIDSTDYMPGLYREWTPAEFAEYQSVPVDPEDLDLQNKSSEETTNAPAAEFTVDSTDADAETQKEWVPEEFEHESAAEEIPAEEVKTPAEENSESVEEESEEPAAEEEVETPAEEISVEEESEEPVAEEIPVIEEPVVKAESPIQTVYHEPFDFEIDSTDFAPAAHREWVPSEFAKYESIPVDPEDLDLQTKPLDEVPVTEEPVSEPVELTPVEKESEEPAVEETPVTEEPVKTETPAAEEESTPVVEEPIVEEPKPVQEPKPFEFEIGNDDTIANNQNEWVPEEFVQNKKDPVVLDDEIKAVENQINSLNKTTEVKPVVNETNEANPESIDDLDDEIKSLQDQIDAIEAQLHSLKNN